jgi:hypothetical protein
MASPEAERFADLLRSAPKMAELPLAEQRAAGEHAEDLTAEPEGVEWTAVDDGAVRGQWAVAADADAQRVVLYCFGGGHVITSVASRRQRLRLGPEILPDRINDLHGCGRLRPRADRKPNARRPHPGTHLPPHAAQLAGRRCVQRKDKR